MILIPVLIVSYVVVGFGLTCLVAWLDTKEETWRLDVVIALTLLWGVGLPVVTTIALGFFTWEVMKWVARRGNGAVGYALRTPVRLVNRLAAAPSPFSSNDTGKKIERT